MRSWRAGQAQAPATGRLEGSPAGKIEIKALPTPGEWLNAPKDFKVLSEDSFSITAKKETDLYNSVDGPHAPRACRDSQDCDAIARRLAQVKVLLAHAWRIGQSVGHKTPRAC